MQREKSITVGGTTAYQHQASKCFHQEVETQDQKLFNKNVFKIKKKQAYTQRRGRVGNLTNSRGVSVVTYHMPSFKC